MAEFLIIAWAIGHTLGMLIYCVVMAIVILYITVATFPLSLIFWWIVLRCYLGVC